MAGFMASLLQISNVIDDETKELFGKFVGAALMSGNPNQFVKTALRRALEPDAPAKPTMVDAEVVEVKAEKRRVKR